MTWLHRYRVRHYLANTLWIFPVLSILVAIAAVRVVYRIDSNLDWELGIHPDTVRAVLATLASTMFTFIVFVSSALLVAVQLASTQLTPRIIAIVFRSAGIRFSLTVFVFTFTFSLGALIRVKDAVPALTMYVATYGCMLSLAVFLILIDQVGKALRPSGALRNVAMLGRSVIKCVYPHSLASAESGPRAEVAQLLDGVPALTVNCTKDGVVLAFDVNGLPALAENLNCVIELVPQVGDHIAVGDPLFRVFGRGKMPEVASLLHSVEVGLERTLEQDPAFAFRIMVDIASKGLSPAINDPTTAVLAIDQIHHLLRFVGTRDLDTGVVRDSSGRARLVFRTPDWRDFVRLAVTEIRQFGGESIQIARRLRAMLENLIQCLPECRAAALRPELTLVHRSTERFFTEPEDRALADESDTQGVGGKRSRE